MTMLAIAGLFFLAIHIVPATPLRGWATAALGEGPYLGLFSLVSVAAIWWWVRAFEAAPHDPGLWSYAPWWPWLKAVILLFAAVLAVAGAATPNPSLPNAAALLDRPDIGGGIFAITRHPLMWAFGLWGIAHLISQPNWRGFWFFGVFAITALGGAALQEQRKGSQYGAAWERFAARTSFVPFLAIAAGRARLSLSQIGWWRIALAVVLWAAILHLHPRLFGAAPLPGLR